MQVGSIHSFLIFRTKEKQVPYRWLALAVPVVGPFITFRCTRDTNYLACTDSRTDFRYTFQDGETLWMDARNREGGFEWRHIGARRHGPGRHSARKEAHSCVADGPSTGVYLMYSSISVLGTDHIPFSCARCCGRYTRSPPAVPTYPTIRAGSAGWIDGR